MATEWVYPLVGIQERRLSTDFLHLRLHYTADPEKDMAWARRYSVRYGGMQSPRWRREMEIDYGAAEGQPVYPMLDRNIHNAQIELNDDWLVYRVIDNGIRHPTVCLWVAVNGCRDRHVFAEYFATNKSIGFNCQEIKRRTFKFLNTETVSRTLIDPETRKRTGKDLRTIKSEYDKFFTTECADNSRLGYDAVINGLMSTIARKAIATGTIGPDSHLAKEYMADFDLSQDELLAMAERPALTFDLRFVGTCFGQMRNLRWKRLTGDASQKAVPEDIMDKDDDGPDCVRYVMQARLGHEKPSMGRKNFSIWDILGRHKARGHYATRASG